MMLLFVPVLLTACAPDVGGAVDAKSPDAPVFAWCLGDPAPAWRDESDWNHWGNDLLTELSPWHTAQDVVVVPGEPAVVEGKFTYGPTSKDLQDEWVEAWIDDCRGGHELVGAALTDSDGRARLEVPASLLPDAGAARLTWRVLGDLTTTTQEVWVLPIGSRIAVFDIDGTLTTSDAELIEELVADLLGGESVPVARSGALDAVWRRVSQGYVPLFVTGRPYYLRGITEDWLALMGMPAAALRLANSEAEALPSDSGVGTYKRDFLTALEAQGQQIDLAYGNATTDIYAYEVVTPKESTFILGKHGGEQGTVDLGEDYLQHLETTDFGEIEQPFAW